MRPYGERPRASKLHGGKCCVCTEGTRDRGGRDLDAARAEALRFRTQIDDARDAIQAAPDESLAVACDDMRKARDAAEAERDDVVRDRDRAQQLADERAKTCAALAKDVRTITGELHRQLDASRAEAEAARAKIAEEVAWRNDMRRESTKNAVLAVRAIEERDAARAEARKLAEAAKRAVDYEWHTEEGFRAKHPDWCRAHSVGEAPIGFHVVSDLLDAVEALESQAKPEAAPAAEPVSNAGWFEPNEHTKNVCAIRRKSDGYWWECNSEHGAGWNDKRIRQAWTAREARLEVERHLQGQDVEIVQLMPEPKPEAAQAADVPESDCPAQEQALRRTAAAAPAEREGDDVRAAQWRTINNRLDDGAGFGQSHAFSDVDYDLRDLRDAVRWLRAALMLIPANGGNHGSL